MALSKEDQKALEALDRIEATIGPAAERLDLTKLCETYRKIRPWIVDVLAVIRKIPIFGKVVVVIEFLMKIADLVCPASS